MLSKISIADRINLTISFFTAVAAMAAMLAAYYSFEQVTIARKSAIQNEQLNAFDEFTKNADSLCNQIADPILDKVWDSDKDDFKKEFDITEYQGKQPPNPTLSLTSPSTELVNTHILLNQLRFQAARLTTTDTSDFDDRLITQFLVNMNDALQPLKPEEHGDWANQMRYTERTLRSQRRLCTNNLNDLMLQFGTKLKRQS